MTYEEFKALALKPPRRNEETIFQVVEYTVNENLGRRKSLYPEFDLRHKTVGFCHSVAEAEKLITDAIADDIKYKSEPYCFYIKEYPIGAYLGTIWEGYGVSMRLYDSEGRFLDKTYCSAMGRDHRTPYGIFRGRPSESIRFKEGDIVEVRDGDSVHLAVVASSPMTIERGWELRDRWKHKYNGTAPDCSSVLVDDGKEDGFPSDAGDDQSPVIDGPSYDTHDHILTLNIMPLRYPLSDNLREKYEGYYQSMLKEEEEYLRQCEQEKAELEERIDKILSICREYDKKRDDLHPRKALSLLADCYIAFCGISISIRTIAYDAADYWIKRLAMSEDCLAKKAKSASVFMDIMPDVSAEFAANKEHYAEYDVAPLCRSEAIDAMAELLETSADDKLKIALSAGFIEVFKYYH